MDTQNFSNESANDHMNVLDIGNGGGIRILDNVHANGTGTSGSFFGNVTRNADGNVTVYGNVYITLS